MLVRFAWHIRWRGDVLGPVGVRQQGKQVRVRLTSNATTGEIGRFDWEFEDVDFGLPGYEGPLPPRECRKTGTTSLDAPASGQGVFDLVPVGRRFHLGATLTANQPQATLLEPERICLEEFGRSRPGFEKVSDNPETYVKPSFESSAGILGRVPSWRTEAPDGRQASTVLQPRMSKTQRFRRGRTTTITFSGKFDASFQALGATSTLDIDERWVFKFKPCPRNQKKRCPRPG